MKTKLIITETQAKLLNIFIRESFDYQDLVEKIVSDLNKNYKKAVETYSDGISGDFNQRKVFEIKVSGELIGPLTLSKYIQKKYHVGPKFSKQVLIDWCSNNIKDGMLSKNIESKN